MLYSLLAFLSGANVAASIILNARLGAVKGLEKGVFINYIMGLAISLPIALAVSGISFSGLEISPLGLFALIGGTLGYTVVLINNRITPLIGILYVTVILFIGQITAGSILDIVRGDEVSIGKLAGSVLILAGLVYLVKIEKKG